jgi:hypothetical protein
MYSELLFYFILILIVVYLYTIFFLAIGKSVLYVIKEIKTFINQKRGKTEEKRPVFVKETYIQLITTNPFLVAKTTRTLLIVALLANILFWQYFRTTWVTKEYQHKQAMEYHALSHMLLSYEMGIVTFLRNPDHIILKPMNLLQDQLIKQGKSYLPNDDGAEAIFDFMFKLYPYGAIKYDPHDTTKAKELVDLTFSLMETLMTKPIADPHIRNFRRYRIFPHIAEYFIWIHWNQYGIAKDNSEVIQSYRDPLQMARMERAGFWTKELYESYKQYPKIKAYMDNDPKFTVLYNTYTVLFLREVIESKIHRLTFRCEDELIPIVYDYVQHYRDKFFPLDLKAIKKGDRYYIPHRNLIVSKSEILSNTTTALCGTEPIKGTYSKSFKSNTGFPVDHYKYLVRTYFNKDPDKYFKWDHNVAELEELILGTTTRKEALKAREAELNITTEEK